ncbi:MAG: hypothetical protein C5B50_05230 [Verrucomicrobia bacterium]|nr:MAG: hypothetical protein C5B50_05230 [Verrucomicrobiota bacterium]
MTDPRCRKGKEFEIASKTETTKRNNERFNMKSIKQSAMLRAVAAACVCLLFTPGPAPAQSDAGKVSKPTIKLLTVPKIPPGPEKTAEIAGKVSGVSPLKDFRVVIYSKSDHWYIQPAKDNPYTEIGDEGEFSTDIHGGTEYAALLVKPSFKPEAQIDHLPRVGGEVLALVRKESKSGSADKESKSGGAE